MSKYVSFAVCVLLGCTSTMESKSSESARCEDDCSGSDRKGERADDEEDDRVTFVGPSSLAFEDEPKPHGQELHLDTQLATKSVLRNTDDKDDESRRQVAPVMVVFDLPDGSQADQEFQLGQTVEVLKSYVESEFGIPMSCQDLYLGSTLMMDPMSLLDYPGVDGAEDVLIVVEGQMSEEAKK